MSENSYNGYTNYETWNCMLQISNDEYIQNCYKDVAIQAYEENDHDKDLTIDCIKNYLESELEENKPELTGVYADLLDSAIGNIDTWEVATELFNDFITE